MVRIEQQFHVFYISQTKWLTVSLLLSDDVLALPVQELQVVCNHPLLAFMDDFGVGAGVKILTTSHLLIFQPSQNLKEHKQEPVFFFLFWGGGGVGLVLNVPSSKQSVYRKQLEPTKWIR